MDYSLITEQQLQKRLYTLPNNLKDVLDSENNIEVMRKICKAHFLDEEKTLIVEQLIGLILLGFVLIDEFSQEISRNLHLNKKHSDDIAREISNRIFASIKNDLEKAYSPINLSSETKIKDGVLSEESVLPAKISEEHIVDLRKLEAESRESAQKLETPKIFIAEQKEKIPEAPITQLPSEAPFILHKQEEMKPVLG
ncbi:MAG: hypothetical protein AAB958_01485, partial [Patescibacteria group bacterium]